MTVLPFVMMLKFPGEVLVTLFTSTDLLLLKLASLVRLRARYFWKSQLKKKMIFCLNFSCTVNTPMESWDKFGQVERPEIVVKDQHRITGMDPLL
jgi:hypothetical protein